MSVAPEQRSTLSAVYFQLPKQLHEAIRAEAHREDVPLSNWIRRTLAAQLARDTAER
jgi:predicted HicB family RNase H-like nuclease